MSTISLKTILEAAIFSAGEPLPLDKLLALFDQETEKPSKEESQFYFTRTFPFTPYP